MPVYWLMLNTNIMNLDINYFITDRQERLKLLSLEDFARFIQQFEVGDSVNLYINIDQEKRTADEFVGIKLAAWNEETFYLIGGYGYGAYTVQGLNEPESDKEFINNIKEAITYFRHTDTVGVMLKPGDSWKEVWINDELAVSFDKGQGCSGFSPEDTDVINEYLLKNNCWLMPVNDGNGNCNTSQETCDIFGNECSCILCDCISLKGIRPTLEQPVIAKSKTNEEYLAEKLRMILIGIITRAVEWNNQCIGTFYKNIGVHHCRANVEVEYENTIVVNIRNNDFSTYGGYDAAHVYDLYIDPVTFELMCSLNGESGDDYNAAINVVQLEGLLKIVQWLKQYNFLFEGEFAPMSPKYYCSNCGSSDVQHQAWVDTNNGNEYINDAGDMRDSGNNWCNHCEEHYCLWTHEELQEEMLYWFMRLPYDVQEKISGHKFTGSYEELEAASRKYWNSLSEEQQISLWRKDNETE